MLYLIAKAALSGVIVLAIAEIAKRHAVFGALVASLPLLTILAMIWIWNDTRDNENIAALSEATFWLVLPSMPMFLVMPAMLRAGMAFWPALGLNCTLTVALYLLMVWLLPKVGINF